MSAGKRPRGRDSGAPRLVCSACGGGLRRTFRFCPYCGIAVATANGHAGGAGLSARASAPKVVAPGPALQVAGLTTEALANERRLVTVLFADLSGSTTLGERLDPEDLTRVLGAVFASLGREVQRYGGTVDKYTGDGVMAVFGAPVAHEDDAERAIRAALAMQNAIMRLNDELEREHGVRVALRVGVNTGEVIAGLLAGEEHGTYTVIGDTVNTAQRLESAAPLGQILVGALANRLASHAFDLRALPPIMVKGKAEPVPVYQVISARDEPLASAPTGLLGRETELAMLHDALRDAIRGTGRIVSVVADAGVGKTRLIKELNLSIAAGIGRLVARCASFDQQTPYALISDLLRSAFQISTGTSGGAARGAVVQGLTVLGLEPDEMDVDLLLEVLGYEGGTRFDPETKRRLLVRLIRQLLVRRSEQTPLIVIFENLHWVDPASDAIVGDLVNDIPGLSCLVIATGRSEWDPPWPSVRIDLKPLGDSEARALVAQALGGEVEARIVDAVASKAGGNPLFTEEVARSLKESGAIELRDGTWTVRGSIELKVPATVQEVLSARLDRLPIGPRRTLQTAAVIGRTFWHRVLQRVADSSTLAADLEALEARAFVELRIASPERTYMFRHALIQEVAYGTLLHAQRRLTHGAIGTAIEDLYTDRVDEFMSDLAIHYGRSDQDNKALHWLVRAGDRAGGLFANEEALGLYGSALDRASRVQGAVDAGDILERMGQVYTVTGRFDDALRRYRDARHSGAPAATRLARLQRKMGVALIRKGAFADALEALKEGTTTLAGREEIELARIGVQTGQAHSRRGEYSAARDALSHAVEIAERLGADDVVAEGLKYLGSTSLYTGDPKGAEDLYLRCRAIYEQLGDLDGRAGAHNNLGLAYGRMARWDEALAAYAAALALFERMGNPFGIALCHNNIGEVHVLRGDAQAAIAPKQRALSIWTSIGAADQAAMTLIGLGHSRVRAGDFAQGKADLLEAEVRLLALGAARHLPALYRHLAHAELGLGDLEAAAQAADRSLESARALNAPNQEAMTRRVAGEIALARGDRATARALLEASRSRLAELGELAELARTEAALRSLADEGTPALSTRE